LQLVVLHEHLSLVDDDARSASRDALATSNVNDANNSNQARMQRKDRIGGLGDGENLQTTI
jgi:hypothetical protein